MADIVSKQGQQAADDVVNNVGEGEAKVSMLAPLPLLLLDMLTVDRTQSIKCTECGKVFKSAAFASFHAEKAGHTSFEESTEEVRLCCARAASLFSTDVRCRVRRSSR